MKSENLQYPVGKFNCPVFITPEMIKDYIQGIQEFPAKLRNEVQNLNEEVLDTPYRPGGWTVRQVVNHCADSHINSLIRFKLALTEENPVIKPYLEAFWAELPDSKKMPVEAALKMLEGTHERWVILLNNMTSKDYERTFYHPENYKTMTLSEALALYAWHCNHHFLHIVSVTKKWEE
ncbi:MAG: putative metal-dependent hydrolase [Bacteroidia bacterium]|nr:putative metal-dependent hydrolase [Bacteroidia bacterium]